MENKLKEALRQRGVQAHKEETARKSFIKQHAGTLGADIPPEKWLPIRDPQKEPTAAEKEALRPSQSYYNAVATAQTEFDTVQSNEPSIFTDIPIDPAVLEDEQRFLLSQKNPLDQVIIQVDDKEEKESERGSDIVTSLPRSVASIDSFAKNANFIELEY